MTSVKRVISEPLELNRLRALLPRESKAVLYKTLRDSKRKRAQIFKGITSLVVLYETTVNKKLQGHYVVLIPRAHSIEYFSSLGRSPRDEMNTLHIDPGAFRDLLGKNYTYNRKKLQIDSYSVEDCGYWAVARCIMSHLKLAAFQRLFVPRQLRSSDEVLAVMSLLLANR